VSAVTILVHGLQSHAGWFLDAGEQLATSGLAVYAPDRRGSGRSTFPRGDISDFQHWFSDLADVVQLARSEHPATSIHLIGHCFGANIALGAVLNGLVSVTSIVMLTPGLFVLPTYSPLDRIRVVLSGVFAPRTLFPVPQDDGLFSRDPEVLEWIGRDRLGARNVTARTLIQIDRMLTHLRSRVASLAIPALVLEAAHDRLSDNVRNRSLLSEALGERCTWQTFDAEHFLLAEPCAGLVLDAIVRWAAQPSFQGV
jgi:alpha-beta hydrolase superfamily lysophospholipase